MLRKFCFALCLCTIASTAFSVEWQSRRNIFGGRDYYGSGGRQYTTHRNHFGGLTIYNRSNQSRQIYNTPNVLNRGYTHHYRAGR